MWKVSSQCLSVAQMEFDAPIGVFEFEKKKWGKFLVSVDVWGDFESAADTDCLEKTLDYQTIYDISKCHTMAGANLIESVAKKIADELIEIKFPIQKIRVLIEKLSPPINGKTDATRFEWIVKKN